MADHEIIMEMGIYKQVAQEAVKSLETTQEVTIWSQEEASRIMINKSKQKIAQKPRQVKGTSSLAHI